MRPLLILPAFVAALAVSCVAEAQGRGPAPRRKTSAVYAEISKLQQTDIPRAEGIKDRASETYKTDMKRLDSCEQYAKEQHSSDQCLTEQQAAVQSRKAYNQAVRGLNLLLIRLHYLEALPECPIEPTTPPPPPKQEPPKPQPPTPPGGANIPGGVTVTHRETACPPCFDLARALNKAADNYAAAVRNHDPDQTVFRQEMTDYSRQLDACEKLCLPEDTIPGANGPPPSAKDRPAPPGGAAVPSTPALNLVHRQATCQQCQVTADRHNRAVDDYSSAVRSNDPKQGLLHQQVTTFSHILDVCEQRCASAGTAPGATAPPSSPHYTPAPAPLPRPGTR